MKKIVLFIVLFATLQFQAQTSSGITYQAVIYNPSGQILPGNNQSDLVLSNRSICLRFSIIDMNTQLEYQETIPTQTDDFGMVNLVIGTGNQVGGYASNFHTVVWDGSNKKMKVEVDLTTSCSTFITISEQFFTTVPFSNYAKRSDNVTGIVAITNGGTGATNIVGAKTNLGLNNVDNTSDLNKPISIATQLALNTETLRATAAEMNLAVSLTNEKNRAMAQEALKENGINKSSDGNLGTSDVLFPTQNAVKTYVDNQISAGVIDASSSNKGKIKLAGDLSGTADAPLVPGLATKAPLNSPILTGLPTAPTAVVGTNSTQIATTEFVSTALTAKQNILINPVTGTGSQNRIVKFSTNGSTLADSQIFDNGINIGIGNTTPNTKLEITSGTSGTSGLRFTNLTSASTPTYNANYLSIDGTGNVVYATGNSLPLITANGVNSGTTELRDYNVWANRGNGFYVTDNLGAISNQIPNNLAWFTLSQVAKGSGYFGQTALTDQNFWFRGGYVNSIASNSWKRMLSLDSNSRFAVFWDNTTINTINLNNVDNGPMVFSTNNMERVRVLSSGNMGIGTSTPASKLEINGSVTNTTAHDASATTTIDFSQSNLAFTTASAGAFTLTNIKTGGTYTLAVQGATAGTLVFSATGFTFRYVNNGVTTANKHSLYTFLVMGTTVYVYLATGF